MPINQIHLRAFHEVARAGSFTAAAAALHVSQPTLSEQVKALEHTWRVALFSRRGRNVELTPLGRELVDLTSRLVEVDNEVERLLRDAGELLHGRLRLGADAPVHAMPLLATFSRRHPGVDIELACGNSTKVLADVFAHRVDAALVSDVPADPRLHARALLRDALVLVVHRDDPLAVRRRIRLPELVERRLVMRERGSRTREMVERALAAAGLTAAMMLQVDSREAALVAVAMGLGVSVVAESELTRDARLVAIELTGPHMRITESIVCLSARRESRLVATVFDYAAQAGAGADRRRYGTR